MMFVELSRKSLALLLALALFVGLAPVASAAHEQAPSVTAHHMSLAMHGMVMPCEQQMPVKEAPCKEMQGCSCMVGCYVFLTVLHTPSEIQLDYVSLRQPVRAVEFPRGIVLQPDHPPPIV